MKDDGWRELTFEEFQEQVRKHVNDNAKQMLASDGMKEWHHHAILVLADLLLYQQQYAIHQMRRSMSYVPMGNLAEA
jgi:hypothetical protein